MFAVTAQDFMLVGFLAFLEGILSIDNAVVLAIMVRHLPKNQQKRALTYGLAGAVVFRLIALSLATSLMKWIWVKFLGGGYLLYVAISHFYRHSTDKHPDGVETKTMGFWKTVIWVEIMDIAFAVDSILAAVALSNKLWIVFFGGMIGVVLMRYAASLFATLLEKFPNFETSAYLLVLLIGLKLVLEGFHLPELHFSSPQSASFWIFWSLMFAALLYGFLPKKPLKKPKTSTGASR